MSPAMVAAGPARAHALQLVADGMRQFTIATAADMSPAALSLLIHGHYAPGRPAQRTINADAAKRLLAVEFQAPDSRHVTTLAQRRCKPTPQFQPAGHNVGRCTGCGELATTRTLGTPNGDRVILAGHPTLDPAEGGEAS